MPSLSSRLKEGFLNVPSVLQSPPDEHVVASKFFNQFNERSRDSAQCVNQIASSVSGLVNVSRPNTISGLIVSIVVNALNRIALFPWSHVIKKFLKRFPPRLVHANFSPAITVKAFVLLSVASINNTSPTNVGASGLSAFCLTVSNVDVLSGASTGAAVPASDAFVSDNNLLSAVAKPQTCRFHNFSAAKIACRFNECEHSGPFSNGEWFGVHSTSFSESDGFMWPRSTANPTVINAAFNQAKVAGDKLMSAVVGFNYGKTFRWNFAPIRAVAVTLDNVVLRFSGFLRSFLRHNVISQFPTLCLAVGGPARTGPHCDYESSLVNINQ